MRVDFPVPALLESRILSGEITVMALPQFASVMKGDIFDVRTRSFKITKREQLAVSELWLNYWQQMGFASRAEASDHWCMAHCDKTWFGGEIVYVWTFVPLDGKA